MADRVGQQFGDYRLTKFLGNGSFGDVYLGEHVYEKTQAAVKILQAKLSDKDMKEFINEASTIFRLKHPNIVQLLAFGIGKDDVPFLAMNYAPNGPLSGRHPRGIPLLPGTIIPYVTQIADALQYAHDRGLIHRDVKPENVLLGSKDEVLLSDFGIAVVRHNTYSQRTENRSGTAPYMAPEQWRGKPLPASDQYALGIMVYEWLCGESPFIGDSLQLMYQHFHEPVPQLCSKVSTISYEIEQVIIKALAKDPQQRFPHIQDFAQALEEAYHEEQNLSLLSNLMPQDAHMMEEEAFADSLPFQPRRNPIKRVRASIASLVQEKSLFARKTPPSPMRYRRHSILWFLAGNISSIILIALIGGLFLQTHLDDLRYGFPRTFQIDAVVGHGGDSSLQPSHFIAINLNRIISVIEYPAGNPALARDYVIPHSMNDQVSISTPVTLEFRDVSGDNRPDMIVYIHLPKQDESFVFVNDGTNFRPSNSSDHIHL